MPRNIETILNAELGHLLCARHPEWVPNRTLFTECTDVIKESAAARIDLLVHPPGGQPVAIETEFKTGPQVDREAASRLGKTVNSTQETIESAISVGMPERLRQDPQQLEGADLEFATHQLDENDSPVRWPEIDWISGKVDRLADTIEFVSLSERRLAAGASTLENAIAGVSVVLRRGVGQSTLNSIAATLHQEDSEQTTRMAVSILTNALVFHYAIEDQDGVPSLADLRSRNFSASSVHSTWDRILSINYWPIFSIAKKILLHIPARLTRKVFAPLNGAAEELVTLGSATFHDLAGRMFQKLIADRKFLATFYTLPTSAQLLANLAVDRLGIDWSDSNAICRLRIADFACGTGALLSAAQREIYRRFRRTGGDDAEIHRDMIEHALIASDIMPAATHITASMLSSPHPRISYATSRVHTLPYGKYEGDKMSLGALDLLSASDTRSLFEPESRRMVGIADSSMHGNGHGDSFIVHDRSCDLIIMNPPFTRPTNHEISTVPVPSFAGFSTSDEEQRAMSEKLKKSKNRLFQHGNAGLASNFMDLAHVKLKPGGTLAMVLPFAFATGSAWKNARKALSKHYDQIRVVGIATTDKFGQAFSADTGMAECLLVATKLKSVRPSNKVAAGRAQFSSIRTRPRTLLEASERANRIWENVDFSDSVLNAGGVGILDGSIVQAAHKLSGGVLALPRDTSEARLAMTRLGEIAARGPVDRDINGKNGRGPFNVRPLKPGEVPTYPILWKHNAKRERHFTVEPDSCGDVRAGSQAKAAKIWATASLLHSNRDFRVNSQSLAMCITPEPCIGGTAWPSISPHNEHHTIPLLLWTNSTLGLILFWYHGSRQQQGRARLTISRLPDLPVLDARALSQVQLDECQRIFTSFSQRPFLPANEAYRDQTRKDLDVALFRILDLDESRIESLDLLRRKWCAEPSVHGGKSTRPLGT